MQTHFISFGELRKTYQEVRTLVKESTGLADAAFSIYSTIETDLSLYELDYDEFEAKFIQQFAIQVGTQEASVTTNSILQSIRQFLLYIVSSFFLFITLPFWLLWFLLKYCWHKVMPSQNKLPSKKQWQQEHLTVADFVSSAVLKKFVQKKEIRFVLKKPVC